MAAHGNTIEEICRAINPEAFLNVGLMLNIQGNELCTYALGPDWEKYEDLVRREYHTHCQIRLVPLYTCCARIIILQ